MNKYKSILKRVQGLSNAIFRFPLTVIFLFFAVIYNVIQIHNNNDEFLRIIFVLFVGALFGVVAQVSYERFFEKIYLRFLLMGIGILLTYSFYLIILNTPDNNFEMSIRTIVTLFALLISFIWIPTIKNDINFNESFMATFKSFFIALLFSSTIYLGISLIYFAIDQLLFDITEKFFPYILSIIYIMFAPLYFLSLIPIFARKEKDSVIQKESRNDENIRLAISCPKYLNILISYIIVPITGIFTFILLIYIIGNIRGEFWNNNLLEPMLVSYSVTVIIVYILASELENKFAYMFRKIFPKLLIPIVLLQTISSILKIGEMGITHGRYYVIMYGVFAFISGTIFSFLTVRKNGFIAGVLVVFSVISMIPPIDAFSVSRTNQLTLLKTILEENDMIEENRIKSNPNLPKEEQDKVIKTVGYLRTMGYDGEIKWLNDYTKEYDFLSTFGFHEYADKDSEVKSFYGELDMNSAFDIRGYQYFTVVNIWQDKNVEEMVSKQGIEINGSEYTLTSELEGEDRYLIVRSDSSEEIIKFNLNEVITRFEGISPGAGLLSREEAIFTVDNQLAELTLIIQHVNFDSWSQGNNFGLNGYVFIKIK